MATGFSVTPRKEGTWTKLVIFVSLYCLILESILGVTLVLFLYGKHQVDSKMTLSLVLCLVSSLLTIPLVSLQSLVAWQYNKIGGFGEQKTVLHNVCTYVLRLDLMLWLATSVTGLIVAAQQVYCLPSGTDASYWRVGVSCVFHRSSVVVSVASLVTVCTMYCARELCDRPYDVSIIGIYKRSQALRDDSIFSGHSWDSDETLKNEILNLCRQHDGKTAEEPWYFDPLAHKVNCHPSIRHPAPVRLRPQLHVNTNAGSEYGEITSGTTVSPDDTMHRFSPGGQTITTDFYPISRTSTVMTSQTACESRTLLSDFAVPKVPAIPEQYTPNHKRGNSSLSSFRRFLPKSFPLSLPLSSDPQILALADPNAASDVEKQVVTPSTSRKDLTAVAHEMPVDKTQDSSTSIATQTPQKSAPSPHNKPDGHARTMTMNSADAPEVVMPVKPTKVRRSQTAYLAAMSIHHPHHPNYIPGPTIPPNPRKYSLSCRQNSANLPSHVDPLRRTTSRQTNTVQYPVRSSSYSFDQHIPRHTQSQYHANWYPHPPRWASHPGFDPSRSVPNLPRRNDVEIIYPSTRRSRSSTNGGFNGPLSCIMELSSMPRASVADTKLSAAALEAKRNVIDQTTYRGANRTSLGFY
ncbi:uncharacterized protein N7482_002672 [Penicillium canariense]|uniref:Uncharacterized protein n=1 Tax=Penicillium canariense TaxID=189055 RepID=A0A9W9LUP8_9EURO|nr:uncharacterized protein N7482_002672 [Penicillium canariense]KAJ5176795.1 hypothetical protein N7482_002672 [Penicillium canariense]